MTTQATQMNQANPASSANRSHQATKVSDQTEAVGLYLEGLFNKSLVVGEELVPEEPPARVLPEGRPAWTADPFQALFIDINGMDIAIPMSAMSGIRQYPEQLTKMPNTAPWVDGVYQYHDQKIQVVDANRLLMPESDKEKHPDLESQKPKFIVQIGDGRWGLACRSADQSLMVNPDQVRWSGADRRQRWVLGMVKQQLCALLDVEEFINHLDQGAPQT